MPLVSDILRFPGINRTFFIRCQRKWQICGLFTISLTNFQQKVFKSVCIRLLSDRNYFDKNCFKNSEYLISGIDNE